MIRGFIGTDYITTPIRKPQCRQLLQWEHEWNNQVSSFRAPVERAVATLKAWRILFTDYRRPLKTFKSSFRAAIGLLLLQGEFRITLRASVSIRSWPFPTLVYGPFVAHQAYPILMPARARPGERVRRVELGKAPLLCRLPSRRVTGTGPALSAWE